MTEREYRQDDQTIGYCPLCGEQVTDVMTDGGGWCPDHGRVWVNWSPRTQAEPKTTAGGRTAAEED